MKYQTSILLNVPIGKVKSLYTDSSTYENWMEGLQKIVPVSGEYPQKGAQSNYFFKMGKRDMKMLETVLENDLPRIYKVQYDAPNVLNYVTTYLEEQGENQTLLRQEQEFQFGGFMKLMGWLMPGAFKKQSKQYMEAFKKFAEA